MVALSFWCVRPWGPPDPPLWRALLVSPPSFIESVPVKHRRATLPAFWACEVEIGIGGVTGVTPSFVVALSRSRIERRGHHRRAPALKAREAAAQVAIVEVSFREGRIVNVLGVRPKREIDMRGHKTGGGQGGTPNKVTTSGWEAIGLAFEGLGGVAALTAWAEHPTEFYTRV